MMENIPQYISITFLACVITTLGFLVYAAKEASSGTNTFTLFIALTAAWIILVTVLTIQGFFLEFESRPPRLMVFVGLLFLLIIFLFSWEKTRNIIEQMPITTLTYIHIVRVPVEIVLWWLFTQGVVSEAMTFEGVNYDILSGISAPFAGLFFVGLESKSRLAAIIWNILALGLLINIVSRAIMATPYFFDPLVYDQPNLAVFYFPYSLLPLFIVPVIFFCHIASLYKLIRNKEEDD